MALKVKLTSWNLYVMDIYKLYYSSVFAQVIVKRSYFNELLPKEETKIFLNISLSRTWI